MGAGGADAGTGAPARHGALYDAVNRGRVEVRGCAGRWRAAAPAGRTADRLAAECQLARPARRQPERRRHETGRGDAQMVPAGRTRWGGAGAAAHLVTLPLDAGGWARPMRPQSPPHQVREVFATDRRGHWREATRPPVPRRGRPDPLAGCCAMSRWRARRLRATGCCTPWPARAARGRPQLHGSAFRLAEAHIPPRMYHLHTGDPARHAAAPAPAHQKLTARPPGQATTGDLPLVEGTLIQLTHHPAARRRTCG